MSVDPEVDVNLAEADEVIAEQQIEHRNVLAKILESATRSFREIEQLVSDDYTRADEERRRAR